MIAAESLGLDSLPAGVTMETLPGLDHSLTGAEMRRVVAQRLIEALRQIEPSVARSRPLATTSVETQRRGRIVAELHDIIDSQ